jgi:hypothetical protein
MAACDCISVNCLSGVQKVQLLDLTTFELLLSERAVGVPFWLAHGIDRSP